MNGSLISRCGGGAVAFLVVGAIAMWAGSASTSFAAESSVSPETPRLALISSKDYQSHYRGYRYIEGEIKNVSDAPLKTVAAVGTWLDKNGNVITAEESFIQYDPLLPGQTSRFKMITPANPAMHEYRLEFKSLRYRALQVNDLR